MPELLPHQQEAVDFLSRTKGKALLADDMGLGKTVSAIAYLNKHKAWPVLIVCPASVKGNWKNEIKQWSSATTAIIEGETPCEGEIAHDAIIINYNILWHQLPWLLEQQFTTVIFDECHALQSTETKQTKAALQIAARCPSVLGLSGTPIANRPSDFFAVLHCIRPDLFPNFSDYAWKYCDPKYNDSYGKWSYQGATNLAELHELIKPFTLRRKKDILNLPKQTVKLEIVEMENDTRYWEYHEAYTKVARWGAWSKSKNKGADKLSLTTKLLMEVARCKARNTVRWIRDWLEANPNEKMIVFCTHTAMLDVIARRSLDDVSQVLVINGAVASAKRTKIIKEFQDNPHIRLIVCNIVAAGAGITLTAAAKTVFAEMPWSPRHVLQARDRNFRIGQTRETVVTYLVTKGTIEEKLCKVLQEKQLVSEQIIDGEKQNTMNVLDLLVQEMAK
jgi:SWI/SNF-related matrix-associated actin-dependent regulator 1 of chromatin subfamily A